MYPLIPVLKVSGLNSFAGMVHGFSERYFEKSKREKDELKVGPLWCPKTIQEHLDWFLKSLKIDVKEIYFLKQVHSNRVFILDDPSTTTRDVFQIEADAILTNLVNRPIGVLTADCIPIIVHDPRRKVIGAIHAGRKGTAAQILGKTVSLLKNKYKSSPKDILVGLGPGIGPCCYEVSEDCLESLRKNYPRWRTLIRPTSRGKYFLDLFSTNMEDARKAGLQAKNIFVSGYCTACENQRFYSYRKEGTSGRNIAIAMLMER